MPLTQEVYESAIACLTDAYPLWKSQERHDQRRVVTPTDPGSAEIRIESYFGTHTFFKFQKMLLGRDSVEKLRDAINKFNPELDGYLCWPSFTRKVECVNLIIGWCQYLEDNGQDDDVDQITNAIKRFAALVNGEPVEAHRIVALAGLSLPDWINEVRLNDETVLRNLSIREVADMGSNDIYSESIHDPLGHSVSSCVDRTYRVSVRFTQEPQELIPDTSDQNEDVEKLISSVHIVKGGKAGRFLSFTKHVNSPLPFHETGMSYPLYRTPYPKLALEVDDLLSLKSFFAALNSSRDEIHIATARLIDAEHRHSPVDALLDAVIGLETILNPMDSSELSFRVAMNYAFLDGADNRRSRYDAMKKIQRLRGQVVHGGLNMNSPNATQILEGATSAKGCLRDSLQRFLSDPSLMGNQKLTADFWLDRVIPPK